MHTPRTHYQQLWQFRVALLVSIGVVVPLGYWVRFTPAGEWGWLSDALGSVAYEVFWILLILLCWPRGSIAKAAIAVCLATCAIEFLQLWQAPFLQAVRWLRRLRATRPGCLILGNTFSWADFPAYALGSWVGYGWAKTLQRAVRRSSV
ncbi:DUF2809 domain-containing protein [Microcoleus sp. FACHB-1515]|uniref:ribosomal maturation YjgA family protein n=1 Tax=Cyanophyceae TaxID=3028117 RepID=UPI0016839A2C|nr:DUF2809 domain-containing protein [Microcoleus sp. FACHB-1515]MBD2092286.1 DUF2809 domain-containing protein [Microcoleus sp. FACHB-1515]